MLRSGGNVPLIVMILYFIFPTSAIASAPCLPSEGGRYTFYPLAGQLNRDLWISNYVVLDTDDGLRYWDCTVVGGGHTGHDIVINSFGEQEGGVPVFSALDGEVVDMRDGFPDMNTCGHVGGPCGTPANNVAIDHGNGRICYYTHLVTNSVAVEVGQFVKAGEQIGLNGSSGNSTEPHLHWETVDYGVVIEPFTGPCRQGASDFVNQPIIETEPWVGDMGFMNDSERASWQGHPHELPRAGHLLLTDITFWHWMYIYNSSGEIRYQFQRPNGTIALDVTDSLPTQRRHIRLRSFIVNEMQVLTGLWHVLIDINGQRIVDAPVTVVSNSNDIQNRPPEPVTLLLDPPAPTENDVVRCLVQVDPLLDDPDYDLLRYRYIWTADSVVIRDVTTAASSDVVPHHSAAAGTVLRCEVTPMDDDVSGPTSSVEVIVGAATGACCQNGGAFCSPQTSIGCQTLGGTYLGDGTVCGSDWDGDGLDDRCAAGPIVIYVDHKAVGIASGQSWADAFIDLSDALCIGTELGGRGVSVEIWVAEGVYHPTRLDDPDDPRSASVGLRNNVSILGGFVGNESSSAERDAQTNLTVLSGDIGIPDDNSDNCYHVLVGSGCDPTAIIDGFVIEKGNANGSSGVQAHGGGLMIRGGRPTIRKCVFQGNRAVVGGAISCLEARFLIFGSSPLIEGCQFIQNTATSRGGAINNSDSSPEIRESTFEQNVAPNGAAIYCNASMETITQCVFDQNLADQRGGGLYVTAGGHPSVVSCTFQNNRGTGAGADGGAVALIGSQVTAIGCLFQGNESDLSSGVGGAIYANGASVGDFTNCTWTGNESASVGHAIYARNTVAISTVNSIVWANPAPSLFEGEKAVIDVQYSIVEGGWSRGQQVLNLDPLFVDAPGLDFRLAAGSPGIDAADNTATDLVGIVSDLDGNDRFIDDPDTPDTGNGTAPVIDMGPYEFDPCANRAPADVNGDGVLNFSDIEAFVSVLLELATASTKDSCAADVNDDMLVDGRDIQAFADLLLAP